MIVIPVVAILLFPTLIGAPLGFGILVVALPLVAFGGYLVAATWLGEIVVRRASMAERERPTWASCSAWSCWARSGWFRC